MISCCFEIRAARLIAEHRGVASYRERIGEWTAKGWRIDTDAISADGGRSAFAIPSPARRDARNWVVNPVPLAQESPALAS